MDATMRAAIAEANATRPRTSHTRTLADAQLSYRVAMSDARDAYEKAVALAEGNAARAQMAAEKSYASARAWARTTAARRRVTWERVRNLDDVRQIQQLHDYVGLLLSDMHAPHADRSKRTELVAQHRMLASLLVRRGVTV